MKLKGVTTQLLIKKAAGFFNEATTYGAIANISCKAELIPYSYYLKYPVRE